MKAKFKIAFSKCFLLLLAILNIPIALFLIIVSPFFKIKIGELEMRSLGHCSTSVEIFLSEMECKIHDIKNSKYIWFINDGDWNEGKKICNNFLMKKWSEKLIIGPRFFLEPLFYIFRFLRKFSIGDKFLIPYRHWSDHTDKKPWQIVDIHNVLEKTSPQIKFTEEEERIGRAYFEKYGLKKDKYICFFSRTSEYRRGSIISPRDSDINTQIYGLERICKEQNLKAVRLGYSPKTKLNLDNKNIIDYSNSEERTDFLDLYLGFNCKFIVGSGGSGGCFIPMMNRKKLLAIDIPNFGDVMHWTNSLIPIILFKKFIHKNSGEYLKFVEVIKLSMHKEGYYDKKDYSLYGLENNDKVEIYYAINEMNNYCDNKANLNYENVLHKKLYKNFIKNFDFDFPHFISSYFFEKNSNLFD